MSRFQSLSAWLRSLSRRERRVIAGGVAVSALALLAVWVALPLARRWQDREMAIAARAMQLGQLRSLIQGEATTRDGLRSRERDRAAIRQRLLSGATPALAASNLQTLLQGYADGSRVTLDRVDLVAQPGTAGGDGLSVIPVSLSGRGDIHGLAELLSRFQYGEKILIVDELRVTSRDPNSGPDVLSFSVRLHGAYSQE